MRPICHPHVKHGIYVMFYMRYIHGYYSSNLLPTSDTCFVRHKRHVRHANCTMYNTPCEQIYAHYY